VPVIVRLQGTNAIEAKEIIDNSGLKVLSAVSLRRQQIKSERCLVNCKAKGLE